ncbi:MAG TPA: hypothetical protein VES64_02400 [Allosphingosinicella sp.]|nr:hypothetical protein [Allosphingosinicella sp.]
MFLDHWEFARSCQKSLAELKGRKITLADERKAQSEAESVRWDKLARALMGRLDMMEYIADAPKEMRAVDVYASVSPKNDGSENPLRTWLREHLDRLPGFNVHQSERTYDPPEVCRNPVCGVKITPEVEKGLKTRVACDILSWAVEDLYDVGVLVMDDPELIPSIMCVQEVLDKQIVHVGLKRNGEKVRSAAWGHVLLEDILPDIFPEEEWRQLYLSRASS